MQAGHLPTAVVDFVSDYIDSIEQLEILLLLRDNPHRDWTAADVDQVIRSSPESVARRLSYLTNRGLLAVIANSVPRYVYKPQTTALGQTIDELAACYREKRTRVIELIYSKPTRVLQSFSDAFKFRKEDQ